MRISAATIIRNGQKFGYPFAESIKSVLPLCFEFIVCVGNSEDATRSEIGKINDPKIKIFDTVWDDSKRKGGEILSEQTNLAISKCSGDWIFYIQSDEAVNEQDFGKIEVALAKADKNGSIDGIIFDYLHFYGSYSTIQTGRNWYNQEVRIIRNNRGIVSFGDAQGFRKNGKKLLVIESGARIYHYGWARPPEVMIRKVKDFHKLWHDDNWIRDNCAGDDFLSYFRDLGNLREYTGVHPAVMADIVKNDSPDFIGALRRNYLSQRKIGAVLKDFVRSLPFGRHKNFIPVKI